MKKVWLIPSFIFALVLLSGTASAQTKIFVKASEDSFKVPVRGAYSFQVIGPSAGIASITCVDGGATYKLKVQGSLNVGHIATGAGVSLSQVFYALDSSSHQTGALKFVFGPKGTCLAGSVVYDWYMTTVTATKKQTAQLWVPKKLITDGSITSSTKFVQGDINYTQAPAQICVPAASYTTAVALDQKTVSAGKTDMFNIQIPPSVTIGGNGSIWTVQNVCTGPGCSECITVQGIVFRRIDASVSIKTPL